MLFLAHRKLFAKGFLFGLIPQCFLPTGNCSPIVSCPAWLHGFPYPQETVREGFPIRLDSMVLLTHRKLFAKGFLSDLIPQCFLPTGNCSRRVSYSAWLHAVSCPQETVREGFPIRLGSMAFLAHRKLFAKGFPFGLAPWCSLPTGNCWRRVSCPPWLHGVSCPQETFCEGDFSTPLCSARNDKRTWLHGAPYLQETFHSPSYPCKLSSCRGGSISLYLD